MDKPEFDRLLLQNKGAVERFVYFRITDKTDADDILQETWLMAFSRFFTLTDRSKFKLWALAIARNKCSDYYREKARRLEIPLDDLTETALVQSHSGLSVADVVGETLEKLPDKDKQILYLYYLKQMRQEEIAKKLGIPLGTVKSRLHTAKQNFRDSYLYPPRTKGEITMKKLPKTLPDVTVIKSEEPIFDVTWEEIIGWMIVPKQSEKCRWAFYDYPERKMTGFNDMKVVGKAKVHGIEGVEIMSHERNFQPEAYLDEDETQRTFVAQLTETHCRLLAESHFENGVKELYTFLDGDDFLDNWGFGEDNCGNDIHPKPKGMICRDGNTVTAENIPCQDVVGRYALTIGEKTFDTILIMDIELYGYNGVITEQYLDKNGRTVLFRRYNKNDWAIKRYKKLWTEMKPDNLRLTVNSDVYVHWYDCIPESSI